MLDYGAIAPRLQAVYDWSAAELGHPGLSAFIQDGSPTYAWPFEQRHVWRLARVPLPVRVLRLATR